MASRAKAVVAFLVAAITAGINTGVVSAQWQIWGAGVVAILTALGVYFVPNKPAAPQ